MSTFLQKSDFYPIISTSDLDDLIGFDENNDDILNVEMANVVEDVSGYLRSRYNVDSIFTPILTYSAQTAYTEGQRLISNNVLYVCINDAVAGILITDTDYFTPIDNRNKKIIQVCVDICIYNLMSRLNNYDIPAHRKERYDGNDPKQTGGAIGWLKSVSKGLIQPDLPLIEANQTDQTGNIEMYGSAETSQTNNYSF